MAVFAYTPVTVFTAAAAALLYKKSQYNPLRLLVHGPEPPEPNKELEETVESIHETQYSIVLRDGSPPISIDPKEPLLVDPAAVLRCATAVTNGVFWPSYTKEDAMKMLDLRNTNDLLPHMTITLHPFQLIGVAWLMNQEATRKCCFLADEMGLGKTIQIIAAIFLGHREDQPQKTLIIVPASLCAQWASEISSKTDSALTVCVWHGPGRMKKMEKFHAAHIVITSYEILRLEWVQLTKTRNDETQCNNSGGMQEPMQTSPLFKTSWHRVVLDEAHIIRNKDTRTAKAVFELSAIFKIFASGTPIFNSLGDLYPMCKFFKIPLLEDEFSFDVCFTSLERTQPLVAARTLHRLLIQPYFLHRKTNTILDGRKLLDIPAKIIKTHLLRFSEQEWEAYDDIQAKPSLDGNILYIPGSFPKSCGHVFVKWLRWRQCCVHPYLIQEIDDEDTQKTETPILKPTNAVEIASENGSRCEICREIIMPGSEEVLPDLVCEKHCFCDLCLFEVEHELQRNTPEYQLKGCPLCAITTSVFTGTIREPSNPQSVFIPYEFIPSTKFKFMLDLLIKWREDPKTTDDKTIVISQFTAALDLVDTYLSAHSFKCVGYKGGMSRASRAESVRSFMEDDETQVLLLSLKAGGLGLNLTRANRVILLDPGWNVAVEYQAFARCHRLGQHKQVFVHRLVIKGTLEERMLREYQARKQLLANTAIDDSEEYESSDMEISP